MFYCMLQANLGETCANIISQTYNLMVELKPEAVLVLGDGEQLLYAINKATSHPLSIWKWQPLQRRMPS